jgi:hypothetical protein
MKRMDEVTKGRPFEKKKKKKKKVIPLGFGSSMLMDLEIKRS